MSGMEEPKKCLIHCNNIMEFSCLTCKKMACKDCKHILNCYKNKHDVISMDSPTAMYSSYKRKQCLTHSANTLEFFCQTCREATCKECEDLLRCCKNKHDIISMVSAVDAFNQNSSEVIWIGKNITTKLEERFDAIFKNKSKFEHHIKVCRTAIEIQERKLIGKVNENTSKLLLDLETLYKENTEAIDIEVEDLDSKRIQVHKIMSSIKSIKNKPEETETLETHTASITDVRDELLRSDMDQSFHKRHISPHFIPSENLTDLINRKSIGKITIVNDLYKVDEVDGPITVKKGQPFVVKVSSQARSDACQLEATLKNSPGTRTAVEYQGRGEYRITGRCNVEGDWEMKLTAGAAQIKGSPVHVKVEEQKLKVHTIDNISHFKKDKGGKVIDVVLDKDGCIIVSSYSNNILRFNRTGSFVDKISVPRDKQVLRMHRVGYNSLVYSEYTRRCVVMCDDTFRKIRSFGKAVLKYPMGLAVNKETKVMYVADREAHCVFKFNVEDGRLLGKIGSEGKSDDQMNTPCDVALTRHGQVIVADFGNDRLQMFDTKDKLINILVGHGKEDGNIVAPCGVTLDIEGNIIVSSNDKLQLFDKHGVFIKRIDCKDDGLNIPYGINVISSRPKRVAVANHGANNVKVFTYVT